MTKPLLTSELNPIHPTSVDLQTQTATHLCAVEIGLGSILHGFKIPFSGHFLSLNQGFFLTRFVRGSDKNQPRWVTARYLFEISVVASLLKSLAPAGQKLGPMLSISMQGLLFSSGVLVFGANLLGTTLGLVLLSVWAFIQPLITLFVTFGFEIIKVFEFYVDRLHSDFNVSSENLIWIVLAAFAVKALIAIGISFASWTIKTESLDRLQKKITQKKPSWSQPLKTKNIHQNIHQNIHRQVLRDLTRPLFLISFILTFTFLFITEKDSVIFFWKCLRPLALALLIFYLLRSSWTQKAIQICIRRSTYLNRLYLKSQNVLNQLRN